MYVYFRAANNTRPSYDNFGNLSSRSTSVGSGNTETFTHDNLQRLTSSYRSAGGTVTYTHDDAGSFLSKSDYASLYIYNANRPHVLNQVNLAGGGSVTFTHDPNGNVTQGHGETITYNAFNKPLTITGGGNSSSFTYGANLMRYRQETPSGATIYYIDKLMEIETLGSTVDYRHYLGDVAIVTKTGSLNDPSPSVDYLFRDRLGGVSMIGDAYAAVIEHRGYDAYGKPRNGNWTNKTPATIGSNITDRGFTDHEHLDDWQLIHMNGRGYDYNLGRFLSVDPIIKSPGNSQAINPYSYIGNNPLSGTDPTGYECSGESQVNDCLADIKVGEGDLIKNADGETIGHIKNDGDGKFTITRKYNGGGSRQFDANGPATQKGTEPSQIDQINGQLDLAKGMMSEQMNKAGLAGNDSEVMSLSSRIREINNIQDRFAELHSLCSGKTGGCDFGYIDMETVAQITAITKSLGDLTISGGATSFSGLQRTTSSSSLVRFRQSDAVPSGAENIANASRLAKQLRLESAESPFTSSGTLTADALRNARQIIPESRLGNPSIPKGFSKYSTDSFQSPSGSFQVHFYKNQKTGEVLYDLDYKVVFKAAVGR